MAAKKYVLNSISVCSMNVIWTVMLPFYSTVLTVYLQCTYLESTG